ncbi:MAG TPA: hypothetical protein VNW94_27750 [Streptosporangiaceae bacterium]|nr:hypothetical protein [Streptosporangiaceae bacterium]
MDHELVGLRAAGSRLRPVAGGPIALVSFGVALLPVQPGWLWAALIVAINMVPWGVGLTLPTARPYWRLSQAGLEEAGGTQRYELARIEEITITADDGVVTIFHKFGRTEVGDLTEMGFEPLPFFVTARRLGITIHVLDGDVDSLDDDDAPPPGNDTEQAFLDLEAELLSAAHEAVEGRGEPVELVSAPGSRHSVLVGALIGLLSVTMLSRLALGGVATFGDRLAGAFWALAGALALTLSRRRALRAVPLTFTISADRLQAGARGVAAEQVAAVIVGPGVAASPLTGEPYEAPLSVLVFDHRLELLDRLPARGLDSFQLVHELDEHGYQVITPEARIPRPSEYGLEGLPEIFAQVPGGRLVVVDDGLGWADAAGDVVLKMPTDRIGGIELLTIDGHAWLRVYDSDGDEFFAAPLTALRISRTDLREQSRRLGLPITDAEYDAYLSAAFHGTVSALAVEPIPELVPVVGPSVLLDATRRSRIWAYGVTAAVSAIAGLLAAVWLGGDLGGFWPVLAWSAPGGLVLGVGGAWLYDRNRSQLRISTLEIALITRLGRVEWSLGRDTVGGVGVDESEDGAPRLVVWSPAGRVLRRVTFPPDLMELRRACERYGLPWGPPDAGLPAPPPPEL